MKRRRFIREIEATGCILDRHGSNHDIYRNPKIAAAVAAVPRHNELNDITCKSIRKQLGVE
ncbi:MAG: type II toxin-antitoxin system HicA family toxin [Nitrospirales bacterium]|nr:type II toxin-antitoxin system HicA family toxin [Nitrospira sp.]MBA3966290.1 type II toxin-antitoxin system HicA family toxin [Nitrospirales bacterium]